MNISEYVMDVEKVGLFLALLAFAIGLWHLKEIRKVIRDARAQADEAKGHTIELLKHSAALEEVKGSLSTRYVGQFPEYYPEIVELLKGAKREIVIFCDFPAYASFTDPRTWFDYEQTVERKTQQEGVTVSLTCLNQRHRSMALHEQFFDGLNWNDWKNMPTVNGQLQYFLSSRRQAPSFNELTQDQFISMLDAVDRRSLQDTFEKAQIRELDSYIPLFFWLTDGIKAVFAIPGTSQRAVEYGFLTTDQKLISAFLDMRHHYDCAYHFPTPKPD